jgi:hypothetical protein
MNLDRQHRIGNAIFLSVVTVGALLSALSPRLYFRAATDLWRKLDWYAFSCERLTYYEPNVENLDEAKMLIAFCIARVVVYRCWRASAPITQLVNSGEQIIPLPLSLILAQVIYLSMPRWFDVTFVDHLGQAAVLTGAVVSLTCTLSTVCYVCAMAAIDAEREDEKPGALFLSWGYNMLGFPGVRLAHRAFPESQILGEIDHKPPFLPLLMAGMLIVTVLLTMA